MFGTWRTRYWFLLLAAVCLLASARWQPHVTSARDRERLVVQASAAEGVPPEYILTGALLGGFRGLFVQTLWLRAQNMKQEGEFYEMVDLYNLITKLQPGHHQSWAFQAWDLAYNVSVEHKNLDDRPFWVFRGIDLLRRQGIPNTPLIPQLYFELSWIFHHKIGADQDFAFPHYRTALAGQTMGALETAGDARVQAERVEQIAGVPATRAALLESPAVQAAIAFFTAEERDVFAESLGPIVFGVAPEGEAPRVYPPEVKEGVREVWLWTLGSRLRDWMGMDPVKMRNIITVYGPIDWRTPYGHALYWALEGYDVWWLSRPVEPDLKYERVVYFSLIQLCERGRLVYGSGGQPFYMPNYDGYDGVIRHLDFLIERYNNWKTTSGGKATLTGVISGYTNFLRRGVMHAYFSGKNALAERILAKLREVSRSPEEYEMSPDQFIEENFTEWIADASVSKAVSLLADISGQAYLSLAKGDQYDYEKRGNMANLYYHGYAAKRWPSGAPTARDEDASWQGHMPSLVDIRAQVLAGIVFNLTEVGQDFTDPMKQRLVTELGRREPEVMQVFNIIRARLQQEAQQRPSP